MITDFIHPLKKITETPDLNRNGYSDKNYYWYLCDVLSFSWLSKYCWNYIFLYTLL